MPHRKKRRHSAKPVAYFAIILSVIVAALLLVLWFFLADYQKHLPQNFADQTLSAYQNYDANFIAAYCTNLPEKLKAKEALTAYYKDNADFEKLYFYQTNHENTEKLSYAFVSNNQPIATLALQKTAQKSLFGFPEYKIASITAQPLIRYQFTAPSNVTLAINGTPLSEKYVTSEDVVTDSFSDIDGTVFKTKTYEVTDSVYIDTLSASGESGSPCAVTWNENRHSAVITNEISAEQQAELTKFAEDFSQIYSPFATKKNGNTNSVLRQLYPNTSFYKAVRIYTNDWGESYTKDRYENRVIDAWTQYSQTEFSCNVRFDYVIQLPNGQEKTFPFHMTYYMTSRNGQLQLVDMQAQTA
ncbi:MAG: hypothetical protein RSD23_05055 [Ruthenibacterium sp.]